MLDKLSEDAWCAFSNLKTSRTITGGVRTTAKAKLNSSTLCLAIPKRSPVDIVAPERENPRNGKQMPCTAPIKQDSFKPKVTFSLGRRLFHPAKMIRRPTAARAVEIKTMLPKRSSISACGTCPNINISIKYFSDKPIMPVKNVAAAIRFTESQATFREEKKVTFHDSQKKKMTASIVPV